MFLSTGCAWTSRKGDRDAKRSCENRRREERNAREIRRSGRQANRYASESIFARYTTVLHSECIPRHTGVHEHTHASYSVRHSYVTRQPVVATFRLVDGIGTETGSFSSRKLDFVSARSSSLGKYLVVCSFAFSLEIAAFLHFLPAPRPLPIFFRPRDGSSNANTGN